MIFGTRTSNPRGTAFTTSNRSRTPIKSNNLPQSSALKIKKQFYKTESINTGSAVKTKDNIKYKSKDTMTLIQGLQQIYNSLIFNQFDAFPIDKIVEAKSRINDLYQFYKGQPICPRHQDLLNLYCQTQKQVICVSCVYKTANQHKNHKVKAIQSVDKTLEYQTIRSDQKCKALVHQLLQIKDQIQRMQKDISQQYTIISNYTLKIYGQAIAQLQTLKRQMQKKLNLAFRRTTTVISRYREALQQMTNMIDSNIQKSISVGKLSKYLILKSILTEGFLIDDLINKFNQNKILIQQWRKSTKDFERIIVKRKFEPMTKVDTYIVTQF